MAISIKTTFGSTVVTASGETAQEALRGIAPFEEAKQKILASGSRVEDWVFNVRTPQGYVFYEMKNLVDGRELKFSETKEGNVLYAKEIEEPYQGAP